MAGLSVDRADLTYHIYHQSRFEADRRTFNPMQQASPCEMSDMRLDVIGLGGGNIDFRLFARNIFNEEACIPGQQGVLNSAPNGTFGVVGMAPFNPSRYHLAWPPQACRSRSEKGEQLQAATGQPSLPYGRHAILSFQIDSRRTQCPTVLGLPG